MYAIGGNAEAARRAGIRVDRLRISAFVFCSTLAAIAGIVAASRQLGVDSEHSAAATSLLYAVGAAVIGGTSLFGGKGRVLDAIIGGALIAVIDNGMGLHRLRREPQVHRDRHRAADRGRRRRAIPTTGGCRG